MRDHRPGERHVLIASLGNRFVWLFELPAGNNGAAARKKHPFHPRLPGRFKNVVGAGQVVALDLLPGIIPSGFGREMNDDILTVKRGTHGVEIRDIRPVAEHAGDIAAIESSQPITRRQRLAQHAADEATHTGDQQVGLCHGSYL